MKSPITGGNATLMEEKAVSVFRGEEFTYIRYYYRCDDTGTAFTNAETDEKGLEQIYSQYREKYGIPAPDEIKSIRKQYGLSAVTMSKILGIGDNQYGLYEGGEMPTKNIGRMIATIKDKNIFLMYVDMAKNQFEKEVYERILERIENGRGMMSYKVDIDNYSFNCCFVLPSQNVVYKEKGNGRWSRKTTDQLFVLE